MVICQQKWLKTLSLGIIFSLSSAISANGFTVSYFYEEDPGNPGGLGVAPRPPGESNKPLFDIAEANGGFVTFGYQFSVDPDPGAENLQISAVGVFATPDNEFTPAQGNPNDYFTIPAQDPQTPTPFAFLEAEHQVGLWRVNSSGDPINESGSVVSPESALITSLTIKPGDPDNPGNPNPDLAYIEGFAYAALDSPISLSGSQQFFRLGVTHTGGDQVPPEDLPDIAWLDNLSGGDLTFPSVGLNGLPDPGAAIDPNLALQLATDVAGGTGNLLGYAQGYYGVPTSGTDTLAFPDLPTSRGDK